MPLEADVARRGRDLGVAGKMRVWQRQRELVPGAVTIDFRALELEANPGFRLHGRQYDSAERAKLWVAALLSLAAERERLAWAVVPPRVPQ